MNTLNIIIIFISLIISGCGFYGWNASGKVWVRGSYNIENMAPDSDVFVKVLWNGIVPRPGDAAMYCYKAKVIKTDKNGRFSSGGAWMLPKPYPITYMTAAVSVYKLGYQQELDFTNPDEYYIIPANETPKARLFRLSLYSDIDECPDIVRDENLKEYLITILKEAKSLPIPNIEKEYHYLEIKKRVDDMK